MAKLIDFQCQNCGAVREGFDDEPPVCIECSIDFMGIARLANKMQPIFSPKNNSQRWRHRDK